MTSEKNQICRISCFEMAKLQGKGRLQIGPRLDEWEKKFALKITKAKQIYFLQQTHLISTDMQ